MWSGHNCLEIADLITEMKGADVWSISRYSKSSSREIGGSDMLGVGNFCDLEILFLWLLQTPSDPYS